MHHNDASICSNKDWSGSLVGGLLRGKRSSSDLSKLRESERFLSELLYLRSLEFRIVENDSLDDMDALMSGRVTTRKLTVHLGNSTAKSSVSVFLVHVNIILSCEVLKNNTVVLDRVGVLFEDLTD